MASFSFAEEEVSYSPPDIQSASESITIDTNSEPIGMSHKYRLMHLEIQEPEKLPAVLENGRIIVSTVQSYSVAAR